MPVIDTAMLTAMRSAINELLPDTCYLVTLSSTPDGLGGVTRSRSTTGTEICRLDMVRGREEVTGGAIQPYLHYMMSLPYDTTVSSANLVVHNGVDYSVKSINANQSWVAVARVELEKA